MKRLAPYFAVAVLSAAGTVAFQAASGTAFTNKRSPTIEVPLETSVTFDGLAWSCDFQRQA